MYKIEKNIPVADGRGLHTLAKYPFDSMEKGDSFSFPEGEYSRVRSAAFFNAKIKGVKFSVSNKFLRCWRIA